MLCNIDAPPIYPCVYREHFRVVALNGNVYGLSLCVQGTHSRLKVHLKFCRFIPVCTGNAVIHPRTRLKLAVYPCVYRERCVYLTSQCGFFGLSLCVQGTQDQCIKPTLPTRFIPVCTGNAPIITYCFIFKILTVKFLPIF